MEVQHYNITRVLTSVDPINEIDWISVNWYIYFCL